MEQIITSILDTDLYKISMQNFVYNFHPNAKVKYVFKCRNKDVKLGFLAPLINDQIKQMKSIQMTNEEREYVVSLGFLSNDYLDCLSNYRFNPEEVSCYAEYERKDYFEANPHPDSDLVIEIEGLWHKAILWEVPLLAIVNQLYFKERSDFRTVEGAGIRNLKDKINLIRNHPQFKFAEFGTRRRYSKDWQEYVVKEMLKYIPNNIIGTSNVSLARKYRIKSIGTQAHEIFSAYLAFVDNIRNAQKGALHDWLAHYDTPTGAKLGIALTDTFGSKSFFKDFNSVLANSYDGIRHDSGCPVEFAEKAIAHYKKLGIDPRTKSLVFSDGLTVKRALELFELFTGRIAVSFGIGTSLTNDLNVTPLNIVIKLIEVNNTPVVKISDEPNKAIGNKEMIETVIRAYGD